MRIGVISDTHDRLPTVERAVAYFIERQVDAVLHAGDYVAPFAAKLLSPDVLPMPLYCIYGNNDGERAGLKGVLPNLVDGPLHVDLSGRKVVMHHFIEWMDAGEYADADVVVTGHTHQIVNQQADGKLMLNPGECCGWLSGRCTVAVLDLQELQAEIVDIPSS